MTTKSYTLLTGATGLLGRVLMRDLLRKGHQLAVLIRAPGSGNALDRINRILTAPQLTDHRPVVMPSVVAGSIDGAKQELSIAKSDRDWIEKNVSEVIHCAASLSFEYSAHSNEPYRTNVEGTRALIDFCRSVGVSSFHHVSTAYVCGNSHGLIKETEIDQGQSPKNVYEDSKLQAELIISNAKRDFERVTIYRPSIIVGEYTTGFTSTFHGFYLPLKILASLPPSVTGSVHPSYFWKALGMSDDDYKNLVPVDWVSLAMARIISDPSLQSQTYHLTHWQPTAVSLIGEAFAEAINLEPRAKQGQIDQDLFDYFAGQMKPYQSYWGNDPQFDDANLKAALSDLPAPRISKATLLRLARFALSNRFLWTD